MLRWGVLGTAKIAVEKVIPALRSAPGSQVVAIASRSLENARKVAETFEIDAVYGDYEEVLRDPNVDAVYIPLPNDMHCEWTVRAAGAGKHVLCEKPIALNADEADRIAEAQRKNNVLIVEAFMIRTHPLWLRIHELVVEGAIGDLQSVVSVFSYRNLDASNIRNKIEHGGGSLYDIGCYCVNVSRWMFGDEPLSVNSRIRRSEEFGTDETTSAVLEFEKGHAVFTCSTNMISHQRVELLGTEGRIEVPIPFNIPRNEPTRFYIDSVGARGGASQKVVEISAADQYVTQAIAFSKLLTGGSLSEPISEARANMRVIDRVFSDAERTTSA